MNWDAYPECEPPLTVYGGGFFISIEEKYENYRIKRGMLFPVHFFVSFFVILVLSISGCDTYQAINSKTVWSVNGGLKT